MFRAPGYNGRVSMNPLYPTYKTRLFTRGIEYFEETIASDIYICSCNNWREIYTIVYRPSIKLALNSPSSSISYTTSSKMSSYGIPNSSGIIL